MAFAPGAFVGTAEYYVKYRPPYPQALISDLVKRARVPRTGTLLDLACGTGRVVLALAPYVGEAWGVDLEPEMLAAAMQLDSRRPPESAPIHWIEADAETFCPPAPVDLITLGDAFHRLDQPKVARHALRWLNPGGALATLGCYNFMGGPEPWQRRVTGIMEEFTGRKLTAASRPAPHTHPDEAVLSAAGFQDVATHSFDHVQEWTVDALIGFLHSTSVCSHRVLAERAEEFDDRLRRALASLEPSGIFREVTRFGYTFGRKPLPAPK